MGGLKNKYIIKLALWFEKSIYKNAEHIVALSPGMKDGVVKVGTSVDKVTMIPNMSKIDKFWPRDRSLELIKELNIKENSFKIIYFGAMGEANAIEYILDTVELLKGHEDIEFLFIGGGAKKDQLIDRIKNQPLNNASYLGVFSMEKTSEIVNLCDVSLVTFSNIPILGTNSPNKLFDSLSAGKPIIVNSNGWTKKLVEEHECGIYVNPESPKDFVEKLIQLKNSPKMMLKMGLNSRKLAEAKFDKSILCKKFANVVEALEING